MVGNAATGSFRFWEFVDAIPKAVFSASGFRDLWLEDMATIVGRRFA